MNRILLSYMGADFAFLLGGVLLLAGSFIMNSEINGPSTVANAPEVLLMKVFPREGE